MSETTSDAPEPLPCSPCRGTGRLVSGYGGTPHEVTCAWCEGTGTSIPEHDAQEAGLRLREAGAAAPDGD